MSDRLEKKSVTPSSESSSFFQRVQRLTAALAAKVAGGEILQNPHVAEIAGDGNFDQRRRLDARHLYETGFCDVVARRAV